jgi:hypothetical protein
VTVAESVPVIHHVVDELLGDPVERSPSAPGSPWLVALATALYREKGRSAKDLGRP